MFICDIRIVWRCLKTEILQFNQGNTVRVPRSIITSATATCVAHMKHKSHSNALWKNPRINKRTKTTQDQISIYRIIVAKISVPEIHHVPSGNRMNKVLFLGWHSGRRQHIGFFNRCKNVQKAIELQICAWQLIKRKFNSKMWKFNLHRIDQRVVLRSLKKIAIRWIAPIQLSNNRPL
jgi:hypothetical protein